MPHAPAVACPNAAKTTLGSSESVHPGLPSTFVYGQDVLYAARGRACMDAGGRRRREQAVEDARSRDGQDVLYAAGARKLKVRTQLASNSVTGVTAWRLILGRHILVSPACGRQAGNSDSVRVSFISFKSIKPRPHNKTSASGCRACCKPGWTSMLCRRSRPSRAAPGGMTR